MARARHHEHDEEEGQHEAEGDEVVVLQAVGHGLSLHAAKGWGLYLGVGAAEAVDVGREGIELAMQHAVGEGVAHETGRHVGQGQAGGQRQQAVGG